MVVALTCDWLCVSLIPYLHSHQDLMIVNSRSLVYTDYTCLPPHFSCRYTAQQPGLHQHQSCLHTHPHSPHPRNHSYMLNEKKTVRQWIRGGSTLKMLYLASKTTCVHFQVLSLDHFCHLLSLISITQCNSAFLNTFSMDLSLVDWGMYLKKMSINPNVPNPPRPHPCPKNNDTDLASHIRVQYYLCTLYVPENNGLTLLFLVGEDM